MMPKSFLPGILKNDIDNDALDQVVFADVTLWKTDKVRQIDDRRQLVNLKIPSIPQEFTHSPWEREKKREREIQLNPLYPRIFSPVNPFTPSCPVPLIGRIYGRGEFGALLDATVFSVTERNGDA